MLLSLTYGQDTNHFRIIGTMNIIIINKKLMGKIFPQKAKKKADLEEIRRKTQNSHVVVPLMAMIQVDFLSTSLELNGLTRTATFTEPDMMVAPHPSRILRHCSVMMP